MKPRIPITSLAFVYRDSSHTDLARTFREARKRIAQEKADEQEANAKTVQLKARKA